MDPVRTLLVSSGSGAIVDAIMKNFPANAEIVGVLSTTPGAECLDKAKLRGVPSFTITRQGKTYWDFDNAVSSLCREQEVRVVFTHDCVHTLPKLKGITTLRAYQIDPRGKNTGDRDMFNLYQEQLFAMRRNAHGREPDQWPSFYIHPAVYEFTSDDDKGAIVLRASVQVPSWILRLHYRDQGAGVRALTELTRKNLEFICPGALEMTCHKILNHRPTGKH